LSSNFQISNPKFWNKINDQFQDTGGIYKLILANESGTPIPINRLLKKDKQGILYIGKALKFLDRVIELKKSLSPDHYSQNHECGVRYKRLLKNQFEFQNLWIELTQSENIDEMESEQLLAYENEFGELPPLNRI
jgi:hypothetical protein